MTQLKPNGAGSNPPRSILKWGAIALAVALASVAVFLVAAWLFPGRPERFYQSLVVATAAAALLVRLLTDRAA